MNSKAIVPLAVVVAGLLIAGGLYFNGRLGTPPPSQDGEDSSLVAIPAVDERDHVLGNPDAPVLLVEYSDFECPFCKNFHTTLHQAIDTYGKEGDVAWVYRHFPLVQIHPKAVREAQASECVAELNGNEDFWAFIDRLYEVTPSNNNLDLNQLPLIAESVGVDVAAFEECLSDNSHIERIEEAFNAGLASGVRSTPTTFIVLKEALSDEAQQKLINLGLPYASRHNQRPIRVFNEGTQVIVSGGLPFEGGMKDILDTVLFDLGLATLAS